MLEIALESSLGVLCWHLSTLKRWHVPDLLLCVVRKKICESLERFSVSTGVLEKIHYCRFFKFERRKGAFSSKKVQISKGAVLRLMRAAGRFFFKTRLRKNKLFENYYPTLFQALTESCYRTPIILAWLRKRVFSHFTTRTISRLLFATFFTHGSNWKPVCAPIIP